MKITYTRTFFASAALTGLFVLPAAAMYPVCTLPGYDDPYMGRTPHQFFVCCPHGTPHLTEEAPAHPAVEIGAVQIGEEAVESTVVHAYGRIVYPEAGIPANAQIGMQNLPCDFNPTPYQVVVTEATEDVQDEEEDDLQQNS